MPHVAGIQICLPKFEFHEPLRAYGCDGRARRVVLLVADRRRTDGPPPAPDGPGSG